MIEEIVESVPRIRISYDALSDEDCAGCIEIEIGTGPREAVTSFVLTHKEAQEFRDALTNILKQRIPTVGDKISGEVDRDDLGLPVPMDGEPPTVSIDGTVEAILEDGSIQMVDDEAGDTFVVSEYEFR